MDDALRLMHVLAPAPAGGLESVVRSVAQGLAALGHRVVLGAVVEVNGDRHPFVVGARAVGIDVRVIEVPGRAYLRERRLVAALIEEFQPSVVHTHGYRPDLVDATVAVQRGIPIVTTIHGFTGGGVRNRLYEALQRHRIRNFDAVIAVSRPLEAMLRRSGVRPDRLHFIPNAWSGEAPVARAEARRTLGIPDRDTVLGWVGRLSREKGLDVLIEALPSLPLELHVSVVGEGPERGRLEELAARLDVGSRLRWHGLVPRAGRLLAGFDLLVLSSRTEGTPMVVFEAQAAGVPVVATAVGGVPDAVAGSDCTLVDSESPLSLAQAVRARLAAGRSPGASPRPDLQEAHRGWIGRHAELYGRLAASRGVTGTSAC